MKFIKSINGYTLPFSTSEYNDRSEPLYAEGSGRETLDGTMVSVHIGNFPKIIAQFPAMPASTTARFRKECKKPTAKLVWYSTTEQKYFTTEFTPSPISSEVLMVVNDEVILKPFAVEFVADKKE